MRIWRRLLLIFGKKFVAGVENIFKSCTFVGSVAADLGHDFFAKPLFSCRQVGFSMPPAVFQNCNFGSLHERDGFFYLFFDMDWKLLFGELVSRPVAYHSIFAKMMKSPTAAIMLSQGMYWQKKANDTGHEWFFVTGEEWYDQTGLTRNNQDTARKIMFDLGFWEEKKEGLPARLYFKIDLQKLMEVASNFVESKQTSLFESSKLESLNPSNSSAGIQQTKRVNKRVKKESKLNISLSASADAAHETDFENQNFEKQETTFNPKCDPAREGGLDSFIGRGGAASFGEGEKFNQQPASQPDGGDWRASARSGRGRLRFPSKEVAVAFDEVLKEVEPEASGYIWTPIEMRNLKLCFQCVSKETDRFRQERQMPKAEKTDYLAATKHFFRIGYKYFQSNAEAMGGKNRFSVSSLYGSFNKIIQDARRTNHSPSPKQQFSTQSSRQAAGAMLAFQLREAKRAGGGVPVNGDAG